MLSRYLLSYSELQKVLKEDGSSDVLDNKTEKLMNKLEHRMEALHTRLTRIDGTLNEIEVLFFSIHYSISNSYLHFVVHH